MTAMAGTSANFVASAAAAATLRGCTAEQVARVKDDALDMWNSRLNTFSGYPYGSGQDQGHPGASPYQQQ